MTHAEYRRFGFVSRLSEITCGGGPTNSQIGTENSLTQAELGLAQTEQQQSQQQYQESQSLEQPLIQKETALASGNEGAVISGAMPEISQISSGYNAAKASIFNTLPPGAARDTAIANLQTQKDTGIATTEANEVQQAPQMLASIGQGVGAFSLQQLGAALSGYGGASSANTSGAQMEMQQSQAKWQPIVGLAQAAGGAAGAVFGG